MPKHNNRIASNNNNQTNDSKNQRHLSAGVKGKNISIKFQKLLSIIKNIIIQQNLIKEQNFSMYQSHNSLNNEYFEALNHLILKMQDIKNFKKMDNLITFKQHILFIPKKKKIENVCLIIMT